MVGVLWPEDSSNQFHLLVFVSHFRGKKVLKIVINCSHCLVSKRRVELVVFGRVNACRKPSRASSGIARTPLQTHQFLALVYHAFHQQLQVENWHWEGTNRYEMADSWVHLLLSFEAQVLKALLLLYSWNRHPQLEVNELQQELWHADGR